MRSRKPKKPAQPAIYLHFRAIRFTPAQDAWLKSHENASQAMRDLIDREILKEAAQS